MTLSKYQPLVELIRGPITESIHYGAAIVVDSTGKTIFKIGDSDNFTYLRSSSKPLQVLPFVEAGGVEAYHLTEKEVAILCASHTGRDEHVATINSIQQKVGISENDLMCGVHPPTDQATNEHMLKEGLPLTPNRHMCSGKHSAFLALAKLNGLPLTDYLNPEHPVQKMVKNEIATLCDIEANKILVGIDGCSAPVFGLPLYHSAYGFARFSDPNCLPASKAAACRRIFKAMTQYPDMISGPGWFDTRLMEVGQGQMIAKYGADGFQIVAVAANALHPGSPGLGLALKISDGDVSERARQIATVHILFKLGILTQEQVEAIPQFYTHPLYNWRKLEIGQIRPCFKVDSRG